MGEATSFRCDGCGGPVEVTFPASVVVCPACRRRLAPPALEDALHRERMARRRAERAAFPPVFRGNNRVRGMLAAFLGLAVLITALIAVAAFVRRDDARADLAGLLLGAFGVTVGIGTLAAAHHHHEARRAARFAASVDALRADLGGMIAEPTAWLDAWWAGRERFGFRVGGPRYVALGLHPSGYQVLCLLDTEPFRLMRPKIWIMLAAWVPDVSGQPETDGQAVVAYGDAQALVASIEIAGFTLQSEHGGLVAEASTGVARHMNRNPEDLLLLAPVVHRMGELAAKLGARAHPHALP